MALGIPPCWRVSAPRPRYRADTLSCCPAAPAALLVVWRVSRKQFTGRGGADKLVVGRRQGSGRRRTATDTGLRTSPSILSRRTNCCRAFISSRPCSSGGWWAPIRAPSAPHISTPTSTSAPAGSTAGAHGTAGGCSTAWPSRLCRSPLCRTRPWSKTSGEALGETTRCRGHLSQLDNQLGEHWKIGTLAAALGVHQEAVGALVVPVIKPAFLAALMPGVRVPPVLPLRGRATVVPTVGLPPVAGPTEEEHRPAPRPAAPHRAPQRGSGHRPCPPRRRRRVRRRRGVTGETDPAAWEEGGARPGVRRSRAHTTPDAGATGAFLAGQPVRSLADAPIAGSRTAASRAFLAPPRPAAARRPRIRCLPRRAATAASRPAGAGPGARSSCPSSGRADTGSGSRLGFGLRLGFRLGAATAVTRVTAAAVGLSAAAVAVIGGGACRRLHRWCSLQGSQRTTRPRSHPRPGSGGPTE